MNTAGSVNHVVIVELSLSGKRATLKIASALYSCKTNTLLTRILWGSDNSVFRDIFECRPKPQKLEGILTDVSPNDSPGFLFQLPPLCFHFAGFVETRPKSYIYS